ncbi:MAG: LamG domain-containing protein [Planctomycetes bacterium]|nr:LamG domain-containing protein [Planctomycetota bacterium]
MIASCLCGLLLVACGGQPRPSAPSVALQLDFEESTGPAAWVDVRHEATTTGITFENGVTGKAIHFDGSGAGVDIQPVDQLPLSEALTLELNVKVDNWTNPYQGSARIQSIVSHSDNFSISVLPTSWKFRADLRTSGGKFELTGGSVRLGAWQHVALVLDHEDGLARLYVDGQVVDQREVRGNVVLQTGVPLRIGTWFKQNQAYCGAVDSLRIWQRAVAAGEMRDRAAALTRNRP